VLNRKKIRWTISDLVDLEYFLAQDADVDEGVLTRRDRELYRTRLSESPSASRSDLLRRWLDLRREAARTERDAPLPGEVVASVFRPLPILLSALGALAGAGLAWGVLSYSGDQPINLFAALALLVILPFFFALFFAALPGLRLVLRGNFSGLFGGWLTGTLLTRLSRRLYSLSGGGENGRSTLVLAQSWGILRGRSGLYSEVIGWLAFSLMQFAALGFSLAVLCVVLLRGWIADLAFSWQTTTRVSAEQVYSFIVTLARPWAGLADPPFSHPTLEQVAGSRVFLKEGLQHLSSADLQSWWYFLLWAILAYTVLPRVLLLGAALLGTRCAWGRMSFHDARTDALIRRMQKPQMHIGKEGEKTEDERIAERTFPDEIRHGMTRLCALVPEEIFVRPVVEREIQREFNTSIEAVASVKLDEDEDAEFLQSLAGDPGQAAVLLVLEGWQPCITATLEYLKALRRHLGKDRLLVVGLIGPQNQNGWSPTPEQEFNIWRRRLAALGDPLLLVHNWGRSAHG